ncbi:hypothetical protein C8F04DRAFT_1257538 [Mycena alexandri]|uniref:Uncharacterized protein n=1 Tax=Mycena alexandri TaxID=1745969 RepID=A0AAD6X548_9AGAR|nr:hypothetical protein C8F04DRAFT_1257538 [Mycena alexandri]
MSVISREETNRLCGPLYRPDHTTNVRHRAILRKCFELYSPEYLAEVFNNDFTHLRLVMGTAYMFSQFGKINQNYTRGGRAVRNETDPPNLEGREALKAYTECFDQHFMKQGKTYTIRGRGNKPVLQAGEQAWHNFIIAFWAARGTRYRRPGWALQPLPGFEMVRVAPAPVAPTPLRRAVLPRPPAPPFTPLRRAPLPAMLSPPSSPRLPRVVIDLSHIDDGPAPAPVHRAPKRKLSRVIDISDDEEASRPQKKAKKAAKAFWGPVIDLTI